MVQNISDARCVQMDYNAASESGLENLQGFSEVSDEALDSFVKERQDRFLSQVRRFRQSFLRVDPDYRILRWGVVVSRRVYCVLWPNSVWHLEGHHSLIR